MHIPRTDTVSHIQTRIAEELGPQRYKVWFRNATQFTLADGHLKVSTPNAFICGWIDVPLRLSGFAGFPLFVGKNFMAFSIPVLNYNSPDQPSRVGCSAPILGFNGYKIRTPLQKRQQID